MQIRGIGIDVVDVKRFLRFLERNELQLGRLFSAREIARCESSPTRAERYACRFAAKESFLKALGRISMFDLDGPYRWTDIEVVVDDYGKPRIVLHGKLRERVEAEGVDGIEVSLSHSETTAIAQIVLTGCPRQTPGEGADGPR